jgi:hypothetical protein
MRNKFLNIVVLVAGLWLVTPSQVTYAQCPMCRMSAESNLKNGGSAGKGLNKGILYLFFTPYLVIGTLGYLWWKNNKAKQLADEQE